MEVLREETSTIQKKIGFGIENTTDFVPMYEGSPTKSIHTVYLTLSDGLVVELSTYDNPQIRSGLYVRNINKLVGIDQECMTHSGVNGVLISDLDEKRCRIDSINSTDSISEVDVPFTKRVCEYFVDTVTKERKNYAIKNYSYGCGIDVDLSEISTVV